MLIRTYDILDFAHIIYDVENPIGLSWIGCSLDIRQQYIERAKTLSGQFLAERLLLASELTGDVGCNGWLQMRDLANNTSPKEIQEKSLSLLNKKQKNK